MSMDRSSKPMSVRVTKDGVLTIEIGVEVLAFAALRSPYAWTLADKSTGKPGMTRPDALFEIKDARGFASEVQAELTREAEDGSSLLVNLLDEACREAIENASEHFLDKDEQT